MSGTIPSPDMDIEASPAGEDRMASNADPNLTRRIPPVLFGFLVLGVVFILYQGIGALITYLLFGIQVTEENVQVVRAVSMAGQLLFLLVPSVLLARVQGWNIRAMFRLRMPGWKEVVFVLVSVASLQIIMQVYLIGQDRIMESLLEPSTLKSLVEQIREMINDLYAKLVYAQSPLELVYIIFVIGVTPALCEEVLFRGVVQGAFEKGMRAGWSILLCGVIFALFHLNPFAFVPLAVLGIYFSFIVWRGNSIFLAIIAHFFNNTMAAVFLYFLGTDAIMIPSESGGELSTPVILANLIGGISLFLIATFFFWKVSGRARSTSPDHNQKGGPDEILSNV